MTILSLCLILAAVACAMWRLFHAPTSADRVVALDVISYLAMGALVGFSLMDGSPLALEAAVVIAVIGFLSTLVLTHLLTGEGEANPPEES